MGHKKEFLRACLACGRSGFEYRQWQTQEVEIGSDLLTESSKETGVNVMGFYLRKSQVLRFFKNSPGLIEP